MKYYTIIDTNVLVSGLLSCNQESATVKLLEYLTKGIVVPVYSDRIIQEYWEVLKRDKFGFSKEKVAHLLEAIIKYGFSVEPTPINEKLPDMNDVPFFEVVMETRAIDTYLVTGNLKHFPKRTYIVTARQMLDILEQKNL